MVDTVRGKTKGLQSQTDVGEVTDSTGVTSFDSSGFTLGSRSQTNTDGDDMVALAWDAGAIVTRPIQLQLQILVLVISSTLMGH